MTVQIMQIVNNTDLKVTYHNLESNYRVQVNPNDAPWDGGLGSLTYSKVKGDTVPLYDGHKPNQHIRITVGKAQYKLYDRDYHFHLRFWDHDLELVKNLGDITSGGRYILRFDLERSLGGLKDLTITFHNYPDANTGYTGAVTSDFLQHLGAIVASVLVDRIS